MAKSNKKELRKAKGKAAEKKFFMWAAIITVVMVGILYLVFLQTF